ncbi:Asp-tRNA(Asn)/Glu-tRNA(Gln) amidotransferase subunit GatC [Rickettsiales endosymbiont of Trichoplax sp. H2]|uniref:Asp-tRNA(Asn)/Glu-tRNA(Gln) amidotransferase subunit GatC n=1 Tax=Rickettsiales endosymbiont of Trichoplax sp. H2 TaxID=2021221 RepID=UPI0012B40C3A|nr:Asp-tRNA(Asn)/Glu-tRNA(Gln) amidotransferase subunit GatC [Rickettsiales endosymbiont of Trichoplax sp. H2]MSO13549.1 Aspartyl/glutamyl-tRNA(Asn/Gln) amidotransferase subunit C [Rickettsiales endosymbiont of Trichoplax sp. H2]
MDISKSEVEKIIKLSSISCSEEELETYIGDMCKIIDLFDELKGVDTKDVKPLYNVIENNLRLREDEVIDKNSRDDVLKNVPKSKYGFYVVPKIIE